MADIYHELLINAPRARVFQAIASPAGLNAWWTMEAEGTPEADNGYVLYFGPGYTWHAKVLQCKAPDHIEWEFTEADPDWTGTHLRMDLSAANSHTVVAFVHSGWSVPNRHYRISSFCWAMYLRLLKRYVEHGEVVPYAQRLDV